MHYVRVKAKPEGDYKFGYDTAKSPNEDESFRRETRGPNGTVRGSYSNADSNGKQIIVHNDGLNKGFKTLLGNEAKSKRTQAVGGQNNFGDGRAQAQGGLHMQGKYKRNCLQGNGTLRINQYYKVVYSFFISIWSHIHNFEAFYH